MRVPIVAGYVVVAAAIWALLLISPGRLPFGVLMAAFAMFAVGGSISTIGFALARDYNPLHRVGTATGVVNVGGFLATTLAALGVGVLVGVVGIAHAGTAYRIGLLAVVAVLVFGSWRVAVWWRGSPCTRPRGGARTCRSGCGWVAGTCGPPRNGCRAIGQDVPLCLAPNRRLRPPSRPDLSSRTSRPA
jgi:hypothetical protein